MALSAVTHCYYTEGLLAWCGGKGDVLSFLKPQMASNGGLYLEDPIFKYISSVKWLFFLLSLLPLPVYSVLNQFPWNSVPVLAHCVCFQFCFFFPMSWDKKARRGVELKEFHSPSWNRVPPPENGPLLWRRFSVFHKDYLSSPPIRARKVYFLNFHCEILVGFLEVKPMNMRRSKLRNTGVVDES